MGGSTTAIGHDGCCLPHDRHPVRIGHLGHQHRSRRECLDVLAAGQSLDRSDRHAFADRHAFDQSRPVPRDQVGPKRVDVSDGLHGLGTGLDDEQLARQPILGPLDVHRRAVVVLDHHRPPGQVDDLVVVEHELVPLRVGGRTPLGCSRARSVDQLLGLRAERAPDDRRECRVGEERLEDGVAIGADRPLHHRFPESPRAVDLHDVGEPGLGVEGEHDTGRAQIGAHHVLYADRQRHFQMVEALGGSVADGTIGEQRRHAVTHRGDDGVGSDDVQEALVLPGKARLGQILGGCAASYRNRHGLDACHVAEFSVRAEDCVPQRVRDRRRGDGGTDGSTDSLERSLVRRQLIQLSLDQGSEPVRVDQCPIGRRSDGEASGDLDACVLERREHLAQRGVLPADKSDVARADVGQRQHQWRSSRWVVIHDHSMPAGPGPANGRRSRPFDRAPGS